VAIHGNRSRSVLLILYQLSVRETINSTPLGLLKSLPIPSYPWESVGIDFIGPITESEGFNFLMVVIDRLTSMVHIVPMNSTASASDMAWQFLDRVVKLHGYLRSIVSDRDARFTSKFWHQLQQALNTELLMSTTFHPQTDGATERANRTISQILRSIIRNDQTDWVRKIPLVEIAINASLSETTKHSPFGLNYGHLPRFSELGDSAHLASSEGVRNFVHQAKWNLIEAHDAIIAQRVRSEEGADAVLRKPGKLASSSTYPPRIFRSLATDHASYFLSSWIPSQSPKCRGTHSISPLTSHPNLNDDGSIPLSTSNSSGPTERVITPYSLIVH
jgi:hypothetical protein